MENQKFDINKLRIASPCGVGWENMIGDERVRHCDSCRLNVYNVAGMTSGEAESLIANHEGRLCVRLHKRADGTVLTKDCPVGFRAYQKRISRFAGATLAAILGLFSVSFGQKNNDPNIPKNAAIIRVKSQNQEHFLRGIIFDSQGAVIPAAEIKISKKGEGNSKKIKSDDGGNYVFNSLSEGIYEFEIISPGFEKFKIKKLRVKAGESIRLDVTLKSEGIEVTVGVIEAEHYVDTTSSSVTTTIKLQQIERLPH